MKNLVLILLIIAVFFACAVVGYQVAKYFPGGEEPPVVDSDDTSEQHKLIVVHVDSLDSQNPRVISVWFLSLFFHDDLPPTISLGEIYPAADPLVSQIMERSFSLNRDGDPPAAFWQSIRSQNFEWDDYIVLDAVTVNRMLAWIIGPGDYNWVNDALREDPVQVDLLLTQVCEGLGGIDHRQTAPFSWGDLVPAHFHSQLPMEEALAYWERITKSQQPVKCEVVVSSPQK